MLYCQEFELIDQGLTKIFTGCYGETRSAWPSVKFLVLSGDYESSAQSELSHPIGLPWERPDRDPDPSSAQSEGFFPFGTRMGYFPTRTTEPVTDVFVAKTPLRFARANNGDLESGGSWSSRWQAKEIALPLDPDFQLH
jgi:hypothetical protein